MRRTFFCTAFFLAATGAQAQDAAFVVGNSDYENTSSIDRADQLPDAGNPLSSRGFAVSGGANLNIVDMVSGLRKFSTVAADADRRIVALSGRFVTDGDRSWFLAVNGPAPDLFNVGRRGLPLETVLTTLADASEASVLLLGLEDSSTDFGSNLSNGLGTFDVPDGVTIVTGSIEAIEGLMRFAVTQPGGDLIAIADRTRGIDLLGDVPDSLILIDATGATAQAEPEPAADRVELPDNMFGTTEETAWTAARAADTESAYARYLDSFPSGMHVSEAVSRLAELRRTPSNPLLAAENALGLSSDARQSIQRNLQIMGYDTRGIDGIFGPGTRSAIESWQATANVEQTGYLTASQIGTLRQQASDRAAAREAEAAAARAELDRRDRAYWAETGAQGGRRNLRAYLDEFPDGVFAEQATDDLQQLRETARDAQSQQDRAAWNQARTQDTVAAFRAYLNRDGTGAFDDDARARLDVLRQADQPSAEAQAEARLGMDAISLQLVESRLDALGLNPGTVDGELDGDSRRAIRRYQRDRQLNVTGFLDQRTVSQMLVDVFR